jgi:hypothetical protein
MGDALVALETDLGIAENQDMIAAMYDEGTDAETTSRRTKKFSMSKGTKVAGGALQTAAAVASVVQGLAEGDDGLETARKITNMLGTALTLMGPQA